MGQHLILDQEPASQDWKQVNTSKFKVIYPKGNDSLAIGLAKRLESWYSSVSSSLNAYPKKLPLVLRSHTTRSNGFVTLAPRRSEFFTMPPQDYNFAGTNLWLDLLAIHEFRHIVQYEKSKTGFNKLLYTVFGEEALSGMSYLAVPTWFWEGDAVAMETALTPSGRGRMPEFGMAFRANLLEKGSYSYNKQYLRSFKDFVPDHYITGYYMVSYLRRQYPENPWEDIVEEAFRKPYIPFTFSRAIKKKTGSNLVKTYKNMVGEAERLWRNQIAYIDTTSAHIISHKAKVYTNYMFPQVGVNGNAIALKSGLGDISQIVSVNEKGEEKTEVVTGFIASSGMLSAQKGLVVWNEFRPDIRWGARTATVIKLYDLQERKLKTVTGPSRYSAADLSPDATKIATVYVSETNESWLVILDRHTGKELFRFSNGDKGFVSMPRWSVDGHYILALLVTEKGKTIIQADVETGMVKKLLPFSFENYGNPLQYGDYVLFNADYNGIDNIYAISLSTGDTFQVTSRPYGAFSPAIDKENNLLLFSDYEANGMRIASMPYQPQAWIPLSEVKRLKERYFAPWLSQEKDTNLYKNIEGISYEVGRYAPFNHLFNVHSWGLLWTENLFEELTVGIKSQDVLSTTTIAAGYAYNPFERTGYGFGQISYQGFFPVIDLNVHAGNRSIQEQYSKEGESVKEKTEWQEQHLTLGLRLPLNITRSKYSRSLSFESRLGFTKVDGYDLPVRKYTQQANGTLATLHYGIVYSRLLKKSKRDIHSRWGQVLRSGYVHTPVGGDYHGFRAFVSVNLYNPGLFKHHSFIVKTGYQFQDLDNNYRFSNAISYPKGYGYTPFDHFYLASFNYTLPLFYPDWSIGPFLYLQRLQGNVFHDRGWGMLTNIPNTFELSSSGLELSIDFNFMRFTPLLNVGIRCFYLHERDSFGNQLIIGAIGF